MSRISSGIRISVSSGREMPCPRTAPRNPVSRASTSAVCKTGEICSDFSSPMHRASSTLAPTDSPADKVTSRDTISPLVPTAARALESAKCPTTEVSAALNNCCSILLNAMGSANTIIFKVSGPWSISTESFFLFKISDPFWCFPCKSITNLLKYEKRMY